MPDFNTSIHDYNNILTQKVETALLDIWGRLGEYRDYLVLIGGLAPRYITAPKGALDYSISSHCRSTRASERFSRKRDIKTGLTSMEISGFIHL